MTYLTTQNRAYLNFSKELQKYKNLRMRYHKVKAPSKNIEKQNMQRLRNLVTLLEKMIKLKPWNRNKEIIMNGLFLKAEKNDYKKRLYKQLRNTTSNEQKEYNNILRQVHNERMARNRSNFVHSQPPKPPKPQKARINWNAIYAIQDEGIIQRQKPIGPNMTSLWWYA